MFVATFFYQKSKGKYLREYQWQDISMAVRIKFGK